MQTNVINKLKTYVIFLCRFYKEPFFGFFFQMFFKFFFFDIYNISSLAKNPSSSPPVLFKICHFILENVNEHALLNIDKTVFYIYAL